MNCQNNSMNIKRVLLGWSVAVSFGVLLTACTMRDGRGSNAAKQLSPIGMEVGRAHTPTLDELVAERIRTRIEAACAITELRVSCEPVYASVALPSFYVRRFYRPAWSDKSGPNRLVEDLVSALRRADLEGLRSEDYHLAAIENLLVALRGDARSGGVIVPDRFAELDLLLTDAFLAYGSHLLEGRVNPETLQPEWVANRRSADFDALLETALTSKDVAGILAKLAPPHLGFRLLREALLHYRELASRGGWPTISNEVTLKRGDHGPSVAALRERLSLSGDLEAGKWDDAELFDEGLDQALKLFQRRHGLAADGIMGTATRAELNVSAEYRVEQLELNLERWRWLPQDLGRRHILVNIAAFELEVDEEGKVVLAMRVVVGLPYHNTPVFRDTMRYIVLNPYWEVPNEIAVKEMLPRIKHAPTYLKQEKFRVFKGWGLEAREIDPGKVDWSAITPANFPFRLRQDPGPFNALGRIKFMFPNKFNVYLHDTPARLLFEKTERDFSHGCIRIQKPIELAVYLFQQDSRWNRDALLSALDKVRDFSVPLPEPIPIHLLYWTAWIDKDGTVQFRRDIYGHDASLSEILRAPPPTKE